MRELLAEGGFQAVRAEPHIIASKKAKIINVLCFGRLEEFLAQQYILLAKPLT
jgi:hypothetical protein